MAGGGLGDLSGNAQTLEERIEAKLAAIPSDEELSTTYIDKKERQNVFHRSQIEAVLDAYFEHTTGDHDLSSLAHARRHFQHDKERLDQGKQPELVLSAASKEAVGVSNISIGASRKLLIYWLTVITLWDPQRDKKFTSQKEVLDFVAKRSGRKTGALKTQLSHIRQRRKSASFTKEESDMFIRLEIYCRSSAKKDDALTSPFELLLPAVLHLSNSSQ